MSQSSEQLWQRLKEASLVSGDYINEDVTPWYLNVLLGISGWLAACLCILVIALSWNMFDSPSALLIAGFVLIGVAYACLRNGNNQFIEHLAIALSFTGQWLIFAAFADSMAVTFLLFTLLQVALVYLVNNVLHCVVSSALAAASIIALFNVYHLAYIPEVFLLMVVAVLWLNEFTLNRHFSRVTEVAYGIVLTLISVAVFRSYSVVFDSAITGQSIAQWLTIVTMFYVIISVAKSTHNELKSLQHWLLVGCVLVVAIASAYIYGVALGIIILLLGFNHSNRILMGLGVICLLAFISHYYYFLDVTLLDKAKILAAIGTTLLFMRLVLSKLVSQQGVNHEV